jgi:hypothetical protein
MFSKKTSTGSADTSAPSGPTCKWSHLTKRGQGLTIEIKQLIHKYGPRMAKELPVRRDVEFHGIVTTPGFNGVRANGELWLVQPNEMPGTLRDRWKQVPNVVDGDAHLASFDANEIANSSFEITLFCNPANVGEFIQVVSSGLASERATVQIKAYIWSPDHADEENYWDVAWSKDTWAVEYWDVVLGVTADGFE